MEKQTLPNSTLILVFGILSILGCCCYGIPGIIFGIIAIVLSKKAQNLYLENPEIYSGYKNVEAGKIMAIIGLVLSLIFAIYMIYMLIAHGGIEGLQEYQREIMEQYGMEYQIE